MNHNSKQTKTQWITIDPDMRISDLIEAYPTLAEFLFEEYGFHCVNCILSSFDNLREGAAIHGIEGEYFEEMMERIEDEVNLESSNA